RIACLDRAGRALQRVVEALRQTDAATVGRAPQVLATLPDPATCDDPHDPYDPYDPHQDPRPVPDPDPDPDLEALEAELGALRVLVASGRYEDALARADPLRERTDALGRPALTAELATWRGKALDGLARHAEAQAELERALQAAHEARDDHRVAQIAAWLAWNVGIHGSRAREGLGWVRTAEAALARIPDDPSLRAEILNARGVLSMDLGDVDGAAAAYEATIATIEEHLGPDHLRIAGVLVNLAILEGERGNHARAETLQRRALAIRERDQGRDHPDTAAVLNNLSTTLLTLGRQEEALAANEEALARIARVHGDDHPLVATFHVSRGILLYQQGQHQAAVEQLREAIRVMEQTLGPDHRNLAVVYGNIGYILLEDDQPQEARRAFERALTVMQNNDALTQAAALTATVGLARALGELGHPEQALPHWERILDLLARGQAQGLTDLPSVYRRAAEAYERTGAPERAAALRRQADATAP
ncbi:MAG: tetratricopeptide repeat protein, partial [Myxococcales bacterium]|nr:tetratricopeptide repeat protein [Myxococcales bacterium]